MHSTIGVSGYDIKPVKEAIEGKVQTEYKIRKNQFLLIKDALTQDPEVVDKYFQ